MRIVVLLPEPLAPRNAKIVPGSTARSSASTAVKSPKRLVRPRRGDDRRRSCRRCPDGASASSVDSMSTAACSASCDAPAARRDRRARARRPGALRRARTSMRAKRPVARAPSHVRQRARRAWRSRADRRPRRDRARARAPARSSAGVPRRDDAAAVEIDQPLAGLGLVEVAGADQDQRALARARAGSPRSRRAPRRRRRRSARRAAAAPARAAAR